jgi:NAD(P)H-dependent FMN reductase
MALVILGLSASPSQHSRSAALLQWAQTRLGSGAYLPDDELVARLERAVEPLVNHHLFGARAPSNALA